MPKRQRSDLSEQERQAVQQCYENYLRFYRRQEDCTKRATKIAAERHNLHPDTVRLILREADDAQAQTQ